MNHFQWVYYFRQNKWVHFPLEQERQNNNTFLDQLHIWNGHHFFIRWLARSWRKSYRINCMEWWMCLGANSGNFSKFTVCICKEYSFCFSEEEETVTSPSVFALTRKVCVQKPLTSSAWIQFECSAKSFCLLEDSFLCSER